MLNHDEITVFPRLVSGYTQQHIIFIYHEDFFITFHFVIYMKSQRRTPTASINNALVSTAVVMNMYIQVNYWPPEYFADASVRDAKLPGDVAWPDALVRHLDDPLTHNVWKWSTVDEDAAELVYAAVTWHSYTSVGVSDSSTAFRPTTDWKHCCIARNDSSKSDKKLDGRIVYEYGMVTCRHCRVALYTYSIISELT